MFEFTVKEIAEAVGGVIVQGNPEKTFSQVSTDTRKIQPGSLFAALIGDRFDAHDFVGKAVDEGAAGLLVSKPIADQGAIHVPVILVKDTLGALQSLAQHNRRRAGIPVIAVTGSVGKTTTKDMIAVVLEQKYRVHKTVGNYNNEIGLPLTLLGLDSTHQVAVVEMGMRGRGEIRQLARLAEPNLGVISNIGETHIELLGSVENIAHAKGELISELPESGIIILNGDDPWLRRLGAEFPGKQVYYGFQEDNQVRALEWKTTGSAGCEFTVQIEPVYGQQQSGQGQFGNEQPCNKQSCNEQPCNKQSCNVQSCNEQPCNKQSCNVQSCNVKSGNEQSGNEQKWCWQVALPVWGRHNVQNALAAIAVGLEFGLSSKEISQGLARVSLSAMRLEVNTDKPWVVINDAYNANPDSAQAALAVLADFPCTGKRIAVLGNMLELGAEAEKGHRAVGAAAARLGLDQLITLGDLAEWIAEEALIQGMQPTEVSACLEKAKIVEILQKIIQPDDVVLFKGSRGMKMEEIIELI